MLVLSRREKERIRLGDSIVVTVVRIAGDRVRLGIEAPADLLVLRDELEELPPGASAGLGGGGTAPMRLEIELDRNSLPPASALVDGSALGEIAPVTGAASL